MAAFTRAATMNNLFDVVALGPKYLWSLIFRILPKLLGLLVSLMKKFSKDKHFHPPLMELETAIGTLQELPQELLMDIFATLEIPDLIRAGSVCSSWHSAYTCLRNLGTYKKSQTPCLLYTSRSAGENVACLYSLVENRTYKLTLPEPPIRRRLLIGSSNGWLITADERSELHLVNPITGEQVALPSVITIEQVKPITDGSGIIRKYKLSYYCREMDEGPEIFALDKLREELYFKAFVFPDHCTRSFFVVLIHHPRFQLSFARLGDDKWTWLPQNTQYRDCMYKAGLLYALTALGEIDAFDLTASTVTMKVIMNKIDRYPYAWKSWYIIWAPWGDLLQVWRSFGVPQYKDADGDVPEDGPAMHWPFFRTTKVTIYEVDLKASALVETKRLSNHILFLGHNNSLCLSADEHPQLKENHAYYTDDRSEPPVALKNVHRDIGVIDLENSSRKKIVSHIWSNWPCPTWITPNLTKMNLAFSK
ncbi:hypothetical protein SEVIR_2G077500v4 [Setaria viridis]|nr:uncharacterized protein LOC101774526 [Setaria italica]XP_034583319.1 uncharacterized protein LOC117846287 [Setaria viridis]XP_034583381.1 uncharacterized protein LOC117846349 [Setaria viridis]TKW31011.1 hypothetical protein SEVIR_2G077400v2 [Setaria viridis]TKW31014.1 hypothetical protein SEVIR_2G077500v2 [Setaria viridis]